MQNIIYSACLILLGKLISVLPLQAQVPSALKWQVVQVEEGLVWKSLQQVVLGQPQSINLLEFDPRISGLDMKIACQENGRIPTSEFAHASQAFAAVNGTFFNMKKGYSVCFILSGEEVLAQTDAGDNRFIDEGAIAVAEQGNIQVRNRPKRGWESLEGFDELMASGPLLLWDGKVVAQVMNSFNQNRHPRTGMGLYPDGRLVVVTVDGRSDQSKGFSSLEFAEFFNRLGCVSALNLDGGGSTTLWLKDQQVINYPSDNKQFDHKGERAVQNVWLWVKP